MQDFGIVYVATKHDRYVEEAFLSAESVKRRAGSISITAFTDRVHHPLWKLGCIDELVPIESCSGFGSDWSEGQLDRIICLSRTKYKITLNLDTDTRMLSGDLRDLELMFTGHSIAMVEDRRDFSYSAQLSGRRMFNAGLILYTADAPVFDLFREWERRVRRNFELSCRTPVPMVQELAHITDETVRRRLLGIDQIALMELLSPDLNRFGLRLKVLDKFWNYRGSSTKDDYKLIKILHSDELKATTRHDLLLVAHRWVKEGRAGGRAIYDYVGDLEASAMQRHSWFRLRKQGREEWATPEFKCADLHLTHGQLAAASDVLGATSIAPALVLAAQARIALLQGDKARAARLGESAVASDPSSEYAGEAYGEVLVAAGRPVDALPVLKRAARRDRPRACFLLGQAQFSLRDYRAATRSFRRTLRSDPDHFGAENNLLPALLGQRKYNSALSHADRVIARHGWHVPALAFKCVALAELGRLAELSALADFDRYIRIDDLLLAEGARDIESFNRTLARAILSEASLVREPEGHATVNGRHTGDLSQSSSPAIRTLNKSILAAVGRRINLLPHLSQHPFERSVPRVYKLHSWAVVMDRRGHQRPHIHGQGWLSGVYYVDVPDDIRDQDPDRNGWLEFGRSEECWHRAETKVPTRAVLPRAGKLVTFPSYFWHATRPLAGSTSRISFAFDVVPL
jgi:tetratricopeptide (TPR) repeat protein